MKKLFALLMVCGFALAFVACGADKAKAEAAAKAKADSVKAAVTADSLKMIEEAAAAKAKAKADSAKAADSVAALTKKKK